MPDVSSRTFRSALTSPAATLFVAAPAASQPRVCESLAHIALNCVETFSGVLAVDFSVDRLQSIGAALAEAVLGSDRETTRCRVMPRGSSLRAVELMQSQPLGMFLDWVEGQWLNKLISQDRLITYFQPIVRCASPTTVFGYECLTRGLGEDDSIIPPDRMFRVARAASLLEQLDRAARLTAIRSVAKLDLSETVFINVNPRSLLDPNECVEGALKAVLDLQLDPRQFVFEIVESDHMADSELLARVLDHYREAGFRVALDDLGAGFSSLNLLAEVKPDFVKVDRKLIQGVESDYYKARVASKLLELSRDLGVHIVVEGIETEAQWQWSRNHGAEFAQGFYFARPMPNPRSWQPAKYNVPAAVLS